MFKNYYRIDNPSDRRDIDDSVMESWINASNPKAQLWALTPEQPDPNAIWQNGKWVVVPIIPPSYTAEEWIQQQGFTSLQIQALTRLETNILNAGKTLGPVMAAVKTWLEGIMFESALNPVPKDNWPAAPATYVEASQEAAQTLSS